jgi:hypothetical protein
MLFGIAALSALTATIAAFMVRFEGGEEEVGVQLADVMEELREIRREVSELRSASEGT